MNLIKTLVLALLLCHHSLAQSFTVMSFNLRNDNREDGPDRWKYRRKEQVDMIRDVRPTILGTQEGKHAMLRWMKRRLHGYDYTGAGRRNGKRKGEYAALFYDQSVFILLQHGNFWLSPTPEKPSKGWGAGSERICSYARLKHKISGRQLLVFNTHFEPSAKEAKMMSAKLVIEKIKLLNTDHLPIILMGDFNSVAESEPIKFLSGHLHDGKNISTNPFSGPAASFNGFKEQNLSAQRIDYIFTDGLDVISYRHEDRKRKNGRFLSDHYPVITELSFR